MLSNENFPEIPDSLVVGVGGREGREFNILIAWWIKLLVSLVVQEQRLLYLLPEG